MFLVAWISLFAIHNKMASSDISPNVKNTQKVKLENKIEYELDFQLDF